MLELRQTKDGSATLYNSELKEHYHSIFGAYTESMHVFINSGLLTLSKHKVKLLEIGFGTGLNAVLSYEAALQKNLTIEYTGIELFPLSINTVSLLNYEKVIKEENISIFYKMHEIEWDIQHNLSPFFSLQKIKADLCSAEITDMYDLVYFDAFGPDIQPELWSLDNFKKIFDALSSGGKLVTYSSKGTVKQNLRNAGFRVKRIQGPPGKRHMLIAEKI